MDLVIANVINNVPEDVTEVQFRGKVTKVACIVTYVLCKREFKWV